MPSTPSRQGPPLAAGRHALLELTAAQVSMIDSQSALGRRFGVQAVSQKQCASNLFIVFWVISSKLLQKKLSYFVISVQIRTTNV
jgi:hypothetical protein